MKIKIVSLIILILAFFFANINMNKDGGLLPDFKKVFPLAISDWTGEDLEIPKVALGFMDENELLLRWYKNEKINKALNLAIVLTNKRDHIHDPEVCYRGQGIIIFGEETTKLNENMELKILKGKRNEQPCNVIFWYTDFNKTYAERTNFMKDVAISRFFGKKQKGLALIVITIPNNENIDETLEQFIINVNDNLMNLESLEANDLKE